jgi:hypothetical protein
VASATNGFMIIFTASSGVVQYLLSGKLHPRSAVWFGLCGMLGGQVGARVVRRVVTGGRQWIIIMLLGAIIGTSCVVMSAAGSINIWEAARDGKDILAFDFEQFECVAAAASAAAATGAP